MQDSPHVAPAPGPSGSSDALLRLIADSVPALMAYYDLPGRSRESASLYEHCVRAVHKAVVARRAAWVGGDLTFQPAREQRAHAQCAEGGLQHLEVFRVRIGRDHHRRPRAGAHQLDHAVPRVAQAHHLAHRQQARQACVQVLGVDVAHRAVCYFFRSIQRR